MWMMNGVEHMTNETNDLSINDLLAGGSVTIHAIVVVVVIIVTTIIVFLLL